MNARERCKLRRTLRRAAERAEANKDIRLSKSIATALVGSSKVAKALSLIDYKACPRPVREASEGGAMCLPQVAMFAAGHRGKPKNPYHVQK
ncbi:transcriptional antitermination N peptide [Serratia entomophila]